MEQKYDDQKNNDQKYDDQKNQLMMPPSLKATNDATIFKSNLINPMMKQGVKRNKLPINFNKLFGRHFDVFHNHNNCSIC